MWFMIAYVQLPKNFWEFYILPFGQIRHAVEPKRWLCSHIASARNCKFLLQFIYAFDYIFAAKAIINWQKREREKNVFNSTSKKLRIIDIEVDIQIYHIFKEYSM